MRQRILQAEATELARVSEGRLPTDWESGLPDLRGKAADCPERPASGHDQQPRGAVGDERGNGPAGGRKDAHTGSDDGATHKVPFASRDDLDSLAEAVDNLLGGGSLD